MQSNHQLRTEQTGDIIGTQLVAGFYLTDKAYTPGLRLPTHSHRHACFCLVLQGRYKEVYRKKSIECRPSQIIFRPAGEAHADYMGDVSVRCFLIEVEAEWVTDLRKYSISMNEPASFQSSESVWLAMKLRHESRQADNFTPLTVEGLMLELVAELARRRIGISERKRPQWLERAKEILHENFHEHVTLASIAGAVGVHPAYLAGVFRQHYHCSVGEYVRRLRIEFASRKLSRTDAPLADIALAAGFAHQAHFSRAFKRLTGMTPARYRAASRLS